MSDNRGGIIIDIDVTQVDHAIHIKDGDELRNINSFEYLKKIAENIPETLTGINSLSYLRTFFAANPNYIPNYPYGDMYTKVLLDLESDIQTLDDKRKEIEGKIKLQIEQIKTFTENMDSPLAEKYQKSLFKQTIKGLNEDNAKLENMLLSMDTIINSVYANPNKALERSAKMIEEIMENGTSHTSSDIESTVRSRLMGKSSTLSGKFSDKFNYLTSYRDINKTTPQREGSNTGRLTAMISSTFKPQTTTSLASVRTYEYQEDQNLPKEFRFGTQGQFHDKEARVSPLFNSWLKVQDRQRKLNPPDEDEQKTRISHIYFNNLGLDRSGYEGNREKSLTLQLHELEHGHDNIAVITLPADKGLMDKNLLEDHSPSIEIDVANRRMLNIALGRPSEPDPDPVKDFHISDDIKILLYGEGEPKYNLQNEEEIINNLLHRSFEKLGYDEKQYLSPAEMQAVYFHFVKFELTNFIVDTLKPDSFNMSCKDAIDRGGVSSAYYNLMKSLELGTPLSKEEFHRALHAAPTLVKGRGMNHHTRLIWNAVDAYINSPHPKPTEVPDWLTAWRNDNAPKSSKLSIISNLESYINNRDEDVRKFTSIFGKHDKTTKVDAATKLLRLINNPQDEDTKFTQKEWAALNQGKLLKVLEEVKKHGLLEIDQYKPEEVKPKLKI